MESELVNEESLRATAILFCREVSKSQGGDGLLSLINVFGNINIKGDVPLSSRPVDFPFWIYISMEDKKPRDKYELAIEAYSPDGNRVLSAQAPLENSFLSSHVSGAQNVVAIINQEGSYVINIKLQDKIIGKSVLTVTKV